jgi:hypothetical protein
MYIRTDCVLQRVAQRAAEPGRDDQDQFVELPHAIVLDQHHGELVDEALPLLLVRVLPRCSGGAGAEALSKLRPGRSETRSCVRRCASTEVISRSTASPADRR